ncbi:MAG: carboxypeptidase-like regulatory domain-containing protein, partial [Saprospiraceae bacterium]|nr:carboxypeptidase-like regulatory domain-containing protein [Saprospiraceae bacterium]
MQRCFFKAGLFMLLSFPILSSGQNTLRGEVFDNLTGDPIIGANVIVQGTSIGTVTDFDGHYKLVTNQLLPLTINISYTGYESKSIDITPENMFNRTRLSEASIMIETIQVTASRISEKQKESPLTVESLDLQAIKATP